MSINALRMSESQLQGAVIRLATMRGWRCYHPRAVQDMKGRWQTPLQGSPGFPDLTLARDGVVLFRELKSDTGRLSADQIVWLDALPDAEVWRPADWINGTIDKELA